MAITIFPTENDVGANTNDGRAFTESKWSDLIGNGGPRNRVISGFEMTINDPNDMDVTFSAGLAIVAGYLIESDAAITVTVLDLRTGFDNAFTLGLVKSGGLVTGATISEHGRNVAREDATCLGAVTGFTGSETSIQRGKETHDNGEAFWLYAGALGNGTAGNPSGDAWDTGDYYHVFLPTPFAPRSFSGHYQSLSGVTLPILGELSFVSLSPDIGIGAGGAGQEGEQPVYYEWGLKVSSLTNMSYQLAIFR